MAIHRKRRYARGSKSRAMDDRTGFEVAYKDLRREWTGHMVHKDEWEPKHPQLEPRSAVDAEILKDPRPDADVDKTVVQIRFGVAGRGLVGNELDQAAGNVSGGSVVTGVAGTMAIGTSIGASKPTPSGVSATGAIGTVAMGPGVTGVVGTGAIGTISIMADAIFPVTGVSATAALGNETPTAADVPSGLAATGAIGTVTLDIDSSVWGGDAWGDNEWGN
jgi:hypothetical protein